MCKVHSGKGLFDKLKAGAAKAVAAGKSVGIKPSDILSALTAGKTGTLGTLGNLGASLLSQSGNGVFKKGDKIHVPQDGMGFFDGIWKGFSNTITLPYKGALMAGDKLTEITGLKPSQVALLAGHPNASIALQAAGKGKVRKQMPAGPQGQYPNQSKYGHAKGLGASGNPSYPNVSSYGKATF